MLLRCRSLEFLEDQKQLAAEVGGCIAKDNLFRSADLLNNETECGRAADNRDAANVNTSNSSIRQSDTNTSDSNKMLMKQMAKHHMRLSPGHDFRIHFVPRPSETGGSIDFANQVIDTFEVRRSSRKSIASNALMAMGSTRRPSDTDGGISRSRPAADWSAHTKPIDADQCSLGDLHHLPYRYPNDFDDISVEMENITKLLGSTIELNRYDDSTPSTCSSVCHNRAPNVARRYNNDKSDVEVLSTSSNSKLSLAAYSTDLMKATMPNDGGLFQNPW